MGRTKAGGWRAPLPLIPGGQAHTAAITFWASNPPSQSPLQVEAQLSTKQAGGGAGVCKRPTRLSSPELGNGNLLQYFCLGKHQFFDSAFFIGQLSHLYMTTGKTIDIGTFVGKMMSLVFNTMSRFGALGKCGAFSEKSY